ncbi:MMPL family transporter [Pengzhenrongella frigida]|uniref:MMPL family transporter n=1 Tax=Pengzhenrongella frigida TaxID=1259133 RepID=A0A4Q5N4C3_9MICO|nr:MMPL family transporter [Cellulomonas sp. HLT2-17]RYV53035.1 MMPL family transporter [Cellulomonas sp. HLT2-17]
MSSVLFAVGAAAFRARWWVVLGWVFVVGLLLAGAGTLGTGTNNSYNFPGTESQDALDSLTRTFPQFSGTSAQLIAVAPTGGDVTDPNFQAAVESSVTTIGTISQVSGVTSPYSDASSGDIAPDSSAVLVPIQLAVGNADVTTSTSDSLQAQGRALQDALPDGSQVAVGGQVFSQVDTGVGLSELSSLVIALVVLLFTFGTLVAAGLPILTAVTGVGTSVAIVLIGTRFATITSTAPLLAVMLGLAVGVDYAVFIVSRHLDQLRRGMTPQESVPRAVATAGSAVVFAATTVIIALLGLAVARIPFLTITGVAAALAVACAAAVALTLTPALLGFGGWRVIRRRDRPGPAEPPETSEASEASEDADIGEPEPAAERRPGGFFGHWVRAATRWPPVTVLLVTAALAVVALPAVQLRLALPSSGALPAGTPGRVTYDLIGEHFGPGYNGPLLVTGSVIQSTDPVTLVNDLAAELGDLPGVDSVPLATPNESGDTAVIQVIGTGAPDSAQTEALVNESRGKEQAWLDTYAVDLSVTGYTALGIDISTRLGSAMLPFGLLVIGLSLVLLAMVFRSIVVPVTAALGYALSIGVAFGVTARVFIDGALAGPLGIDYVGSVSSFMPIIVMGVLFGLAMDYEVFLVSRMREDYVHHGEPRPAIERGFVASARVVTAAAIIMIVVFAGFIRNGDASIQPIAVGLTVGVATDAFIVRMTLIPAVLAWFGRYAWWFPAWMERVFPHFDVEGEGLSQEDALAGWPEPGDHVGIAAQDVRVAGQSPEVAGLDALVRAGDVLVIEGGSRSERRDLLLGLTGRLPITAGRCKVAGLVLPPRASSVRSRTSVVLLDRDHDAVPRLARALLDEVVLVAIDGADAVVDPAVRADLRAVLAEARAGARARSGPPRTLVLSCASHEAVDDLVPADAAVHVVSLDRAPSAPELDPARGA